MNASLMAMTRRATLATLATLALSLAAGAAFAQDTPKVKFATSAGDFVVGDVDGLPHVPLAIFVGGAHVDNEWLTGSGWTAMLGQRRHGKQKGREQPG